MTDGFCQGAIQMTDIQGDEQDAAKDDAQENTDLFVFEYSLELAQQQQIVAAEVHSKQQHEHRSYILNVRTVGGYGIIANTKATGACSAKSGAKRFEETHATGQ